jgi:hypothetical protein
LLSSKIDALEKKHYWAIPVAGDICTSEKYFFGWYKTELLSA